MFAVQMMLLTSELNQAVQHVASYPAMQSKFKRIIINDKSMGEKSASPL